MGSIANMYTNDTVFNDVIVEVFVSKILFIVVNH